MIQMGKRMATLALAALAGCGTTANVYTVRLPDGGQAYRVSCSGLFGAGACQRKAQEVCGGQAVRALRDVAPIGGATRELMFGCAARQS
ncbi:hypothetical protein [Burkholderia ubonensis]|uniref:hypothetical protein n=1 Tax=Burkholderia ubonensis TaxID=101571 RepID=UPI000754B062|nr:hypothetical protein [Burkholderia ubonensis]KVW68050.1 hypothetical protein WK99_10370 [Burkholderia ubonensis]